MQAVIEKTVCIHCGTPFHPSPRRPRFCCAGCQFVHDLIAKNNLGQFYDLQEPGLQPVKSLVFQKRDYEWLGELACAAEANALHGAALTLDLQGVTCIGCVWLIEKLFVKWPGALAIRADPTLGRLELRWRPGDFDIVGFARELQSFGYLVGKLGNAPAASSQGLVLRLGICAALALNTMLFTLPGYFGMESDFQFAPLFRRLQFLFGTLSFLVGGSYFLGRAWRSLRSRVLHIDLPISLGLVAAYAGSVYAWARGDTGFAYFDFVSTFTFLMLCGRWLQQKAVERNRRQLLAGGETLPPVHNALTGESIPVEKLVSGANFTIQPGQTAPVRAMLLSEAATLGLEWISGESEADVAPRGRIIPAGAVNYGEAAIEVEALEPWSESLLAKLLVVTPATASRDFAFERFLRYYIVAVVGIALAGFAAWWVFRGDGLMATQVFISVLVVSCPCASGVALPLTRDLAASQLRKLGVFIRKGDIWEKLERVRHIVFDKTGTLTLEAMSLLNPEALDALTREARAILLSIVQENQHPVSGCLREQLLADGVERATLRPTAETVGFGLELEHSGARWRLGRPAWALDAQTTGRPSSPCDARQSAPGSDCVFSRNGEALAGFRFGEEARLDAREEIAALGDRGCSVSILSGDREAKVKAMADGLDLPRERCHAGMSPQQKAEWIANNDHRDTLYIGDGANDSLAFDAAWCAGTPAIDRGLLQQKAGFYFLGRGLGGVRALLEMAARRRLAARLVVAFALAYNGIAILLCLTGRMNPILAAILMPASSLASLAIVFAALRPRRF